MKPLPPILIVAKPGQLRDSLQVLLTSIVPMESIHLASDGLSAMDRMMNDPPALTLIAFEPPHSDIGQTLEQIKVAWPRTRTVALVEDEQEQAIARAAGADIVLLKGIRAASLLRRIEELINK